MLEEKSFKIICISMIFILISCSQKDINKSKYCLNIEQSIKENEITDFSVGKKQINFTDEQLKQPCDSIIGLNKNQIKEYLTAIQGVYITNDFRYEDEKSISDEIDILVKKEYEKKYINNVIEIKKDKIVYKEVDYKKIYISYNPNLVQSPDNNYPTQIFTNDYEEDILIYINSKGYVDSFYMYDIITLKNGENVVIKVVYKIKK
ncbi:MULTISPECIES: hypothetical protein [unclassified Breznakia]|uniref:hypothetical protein n=1 Tax=unclassified Breznakia TaxID=2623764 RepID=UPI002406C66E|nr:MULTISPECIES: hypothetical protein [unclassified Breznakia]